MEAFFRILGSMLRGVEQMSRLGLAIRLVDLSCHSGGVGGSLLGECPPSMAQLDQDELADIALMPATKRLVSKVFWYGT